MSYVPVGAAAAAAAARKKAEEQEEQELTKYNGDDLDGWEFKIVRSFTGAFKKYDTVEKLCVEEAKAGWELVEKFDNYRIRFKRQISNRAGDRNRQVDPYRTNYGFASSSFGLVIAGSVLLLVGVIVFIVTYFNN